MNRYSVIQKWMGVGGPVTATEGMKWLLLLRLLEQCLKSWFTIIIDRPIIESDLETLSGDALFGRCFYCLLLHWSVSALFID